MDIVIATLASPVILFFILGMLAAFARSDLAIPEAVAKGLSLYLMVVIGLKGGVAVSESGFTPDLALAAVAGIALSFLIPCVAVPAAMRVALPKADPGLYLSMSPGVTFPFNIIFGIPLFATLAQAIG